MNVLVAIGEPRLQREVVQGLSGMGFGLVEARHPNLFPCLPDDAPARSALHAAVVGYGFGFDALAFGALAREWHSYLGVVYLVMTALGEMVSFMPVSRKSLSPMFSSLLCSSSSRSIVECS